MVLSPCMWMLMKPFGWPFHLLQELENVGRAWLVLAVMQGLLTDGDSFSTIQMTLSSLSPTKTGIPSLDSLSLD